MLQTTTNDNYELSWHKLRGDHNNNTSSAPQSQKQKTRPNVVLVIRAVSPSLLRRQTSFFQRRNFGGQEFLKDQNRSADFDPPAEEGAEAQAETSGDVKLRASSTGSVCVAACRRGWRRP